MEKAFRIAAIVSAVLFVLSLALFIAGWHFDANTHSIRVRGDFHVGLVHRDFDTRLAFYNGYHGPYNGGIIALTDGSKEREPFEQESYFDAPGIYYRYFKFRIVHPGEVIWALKISLWYPLVVFSILPAIWMVRHYLRRASLESHGLD